MLFVNFRNMSPDSVKEAPEVDQAGEGGNMIENENRAVADDLNPQDTLLPFANVARTMRNALPENAKISKEAKECMQECVSEFISFITSEASDKCHQEKRKTVTGEDMLFSMTLLGFENYAEVLKIYFTKYREATQTSRGEGHVRNRTSSGNYSVPPSASGNFFVNPSSQMPSSMGMVEQGGTADASDESAESQDARNFSGYMNINAAPNAGNENGHWMS